MKKINIIVAFVATVLIILLVFNYRYPFRVEDGGGWSIGYQYVESPLVRVNPSATHVISFEELDSLRDHKINFIADPFLLEDEGVFYIFFEEQGLGNANVAYMQSYDGLNYQYKGIILDEDFHLSFPQVFKYSDEFYMLPETKAAGHILLYKARSFPVDWEIVDTLIKNVRLKDPAILLSDTLNLISASDDRLHQYLYRADSLKGSWTKIDSFSRIGDETRAGGNFFQFKDRWFIPFQNNSEGYGSSLSLYELNLNSENGFVFNEIIDKQIDKQDSIHWFNRGMHHLSVQKTSNGYYVVYDGDVGAGTYSWAWKASIKYNFYDLRNFFIRLTE